MTRRTTLLPEAASVGAARRLVRDALGSWRLDALDDTCVLLVSELVTNAVLHARTPIEVSIARVDADTVRIEVADHSPRVPVVKRYGLDAATGRGLLLVERLATRWGVDPRDVGKSVWLEMSARSPGGGRRDEQATGIDDVDVDDLDALEAALGGDDALWRGTQARCGRAA